MGQCHLALLPLSRSFANACKTPIKLMECAAESVATVSGPSSISHRRFAASVSWRITGAGSGSGPQAGQQSERTGGPVAEAHHWVCNEMALQLHVPQRLWLYQMLWRKRRAIDRLTQQRCEHQPRFSWRTIDLSGLN